MKGKNSVEVGMESFSYKLPATASQEEVEGLVRDLNVPVEVPIGVLTALLGGPFFCILFKKRQQDGKSGF